ncbi:MAG: ABC transporter permease subunit [Bacteroidota bacterium]|nr:ABC transporter permease subunit [Bacteroidota bacterium]
MKQIWIVAKRELRSFFDSLMAYIMLISFLGFSGFFTWLYGQGDVFFIKQASLSAFFGIAYWTLFFFIPALTMRLFAEENRSGTIELLLTKPLNDWQVVWGKFLATLLLIMVALLLTIPYYITVASLGPVDHGAVWSGYLGLILMSAAYISIGIFTSAITTNQIVSYLMALFIGIFFQILFGMLSGAFSGLLSQVLDYLSLATHFESISRGVIDSKDLIYFLSIVFFGLILTEATLEKRKLA